MSRRSRASRAPCQATRRGEGLLLAEIAVVHPPAAPILERHIEEQPVAVGELVTPLGGFDSTAEGAMMVSPDQGAVDTIRRII